MKSFSGPVSGPLFARVWCLPALALCLSAATQAQTLSSAQAETLALAAEPGRAALLERAAATRERAVAAGALPDPTLRVGIMNYPLEGGSFRTEGMSHALLGVRQMFPPGRADERRRFEMQARALGEDAAVREREIRQQVRAHWLEAWYAARALRTLESMRPIFDDLTAVTTSLYGVGRRNQQDVLRVELEASRLEDRVIGATRRQAESRAALAEWIGEAAGRPLGNALPKWPEPPSLERMRAALAIHPAVLAAEAQIAAGDAGVDAARARARPGWALDVGYAYRDGRLPDGAGRSDFVSIGVSVDLPIFRADRQDRHIAAAINDRRAAVAGRDALHKRLRSELHREHARWEAMSDRLRLYEQTVLPATQAHADAALNAYQSDAGDFAEVMRSVIADLDARLDYLRIRVDRAQVWAALSSLAGLAP